MKALDLSRFCNLFLILFLAVLFAGCNKSEPAPAATHGVIVISGDTAGWIVPCGCTANQSGGLLRRGTFLRQLRKDSDVVYLDAGGSAAGSSSYQLAKFEAILTGEKLMGVSAHNLGRSELLFGPDALRAAAARTGVSLMSANARALDGKPLADAIRIVPLEGHRVAVIGVVSPDYATDRIIVNDPAQSIIAITAAHRADFDALIVLAYLPEEELQKLSAALPEADAIVGGPTGQAIVPRLVGPVLLASATNKGKFLVQLDAPLAGHASWSGEIREMGPSFADDLQQVQNLHEYLQALARADFTAADADLVPQMPVGAPSTYRIAGSTTCIACHPAANHTWETSGHARAWQSLLAKHFEVDSYCQQCHTTGYGLPGGFESRAKSMSLVGVGCESCHGPSLAHVKDPNARTTYAAFDQCLRCHDEENSPHFDRAAYWEKVRHGKPAPSTAGNAP